MVDDGVGVLISGGVAGVGVVVVLGRGVEGA